MGRPSRGREFDGQRLRRLTLKTPWSGTREGGVMTLFIDALVSGVAIGAQPGRCSTIRTSGIRRSVRA
jgi:hypothetical protein